MTQQQVFNKIENYRIASDMTVYKLCLLSGVTKQYYYSMQDNLGSVGFPVFEKLLSVFKMELSIINKSPAP